MFVRCWIGFVIFFKGFHLVDKVSLAQEVFHRKSRVIGNPYFDDDDSEYYSPSIGFTSSDLNPCRTYTCQTVSTKVFSSKRQLRKDKLVKRRKNRRLKKTQNYKVHYLNANDDSWTRFLNVTSVTKTRR